MKKFGYLAPTYRLVEEITRLKKSTASLRFKIINLNACNNDVEAKYETGLRNQDAYKQNLFLEKKKCSDKENEIRILVSECEHFARRDRNNQASIKEDFINTTNESLRNQHDRLRKEFEESLMDTVQRKTYALQQSLSTTSDALEISESQVEDQQIKMQKMTDDYREQAIKVERLSCQLSAARAVNCELARGNVAE